MKSFEFRGHQKPINVAKFNADGDLFLTGGADKKINVYNSNSLEKLGSFSTLSAIKYLDITQDSEYVVSVDLSGNLSIFNLKEGKMIGSYEQIRAKYKYVEFCYGNEFILTLYDGYGQNDPSEVGIFNFQRLLQATAEADQKLVSARAKSQQELNQKEIQQFQLTSKDFKPDQTFSLTEHVATKFGWGYLNKCFIATTYQGKLLMLDLTGKIIKSVEAHEGEAKSFTFARDYTILATCGSDGAKFFNPNTFEVLRKFKTEVPMNTISISPLMCPSPFKNDKDEAKNQFKYHFIMAGGIASRDVALVKKGGFEIHLCNFMFEEEIGKFSIHFSPINSIVFSPDGRTFLTGSEEGNARLIKLDNRYFEIE